MGMRGHYGVTMEDGFVLATYQHSDMNPGWWGYRLVKEALELSRDNPQYVEWASWRARQIRRCDPDGENQRYCYWHHRPHISLPEDFDMGGGQYEPSFRGMLEYDELYPADLEDKWDIGYSYFWNLDASIVSIEINNEPTAMLHLALDDPVLADAIEGGAGAFQELAWALQSR